MELWEWFVAKRVNTVTFFDDLPELRTASPGCTACSDKLTCKFDRIVPKCSGVFRCSLQGGVGTRGFVAVDLIELMIVLVRRSRSGSVLEHRVFCSSSSERSALDVCECLEAMLDTNIDDVREASAVYISL